MMDAFPLRYSSYFFPWCGRTYLANNAFPFLPLNNINERQGVIVVVYVLSNLGSLVSLMHYIAPLVTLLYTPSFHSRNNEWQNFAGLLQCVPGHTLAMRPCIPSFLTPLLRNPPTSSTKRGWGVLCFKECRNLMKVAPMSVLILVYNVVIPDPLSLLGFDCFHTQLDPSQCLLIPITRSWLLARSNREPPRGQD